MRSSFLTRFAAYVGLAGALAVCGSPAAAETLVGTTIESRVLLGFKVDDAAVGDFLPDGWVSFTLPQGPVAGSNLIVALIDRHLILNHEGKPENPSSGPTIALFAYARKEGVEGARGYVIRAYEEPPLVNPYGTSVPANIERVSEFTDAGQGGREQTEHWTVRPDSGGEMSLDLDFKAGGYTWSTGGESRPHSSKDPEFFRIYRYDQLAGLVMNASVGRALKGKVKFNVSDPGLSAIFDGSEKLVAIVSIPFYVREISAP